MLAVGRSGGGRAVGVISIWAAWERLMLGLHRLRPVRPGGLFWFQVVTYKGPEYRLADGTAVRRGDRVVELHLDNRGFVSMRNRSGYSTWKAVHELRLDLATLRSRIDAGEFGAVAALHGTSLLGEAGGLLGFEFRELPHTWRNAFVHYFLAGIDAIYHPAGMERIKSQPRRRWPTEVWLGTSRPAPKQPPA